ncbi:hypothetical protein [Paenibacillus curdlanolyticus]|uniref:hypothetical protein n=1 Tax=Paenibacillus curdlanolyticus TaxID=59840 RepID=UPI00031E3B90|nr:hypothetical protein [Paenibacillus curdlanolyticus]
MESVTTSPSRQPIVCSNSFNVLSHSRRTPADGTIHFQHRRQTEAANGPSGRYLAKYAAIAALTDSGDLTRTKTAN